MIFAIGKESIAVGKRVIRGHSDVCFGNAQSAKHVDIKTDVVGKGASIRLKLQVRGCVERQLLYLRDHIFANLEGRLVNAWSDPYFCSCRIKSLRFHQMLYCMCRDLDVYKRQGGQLVAFAV